MKISKPLLLFLFVASTLGNCAKQQYMTPISMPRPDSLMQITDEDVKKAFEATPQLVKPINVAVYKAGFGDHHFVDSLRALSDIASIFEISPWLVEGDAYHERRSNRWYRRYRAPGVTDMKNLRMLAAQARADLLIYCGVSHALRTKPNFLAWTYIALLPALFIPGQKVELITEGDLFFVDVRNGFLYGSYHNDNKISKDFATLHYEGKVEEKVGEQVAKMIPGMITATRSVLDNDKFYVKPN